MTESNKTLTAREIIDKFFSELGGLNGMDQDTAFVIQDLWVKGKLGRDELLSELEKLRTKKEKNG